MTLRGFWIATAVVMAATYFLQDRHGVGEWLLCWGVAMLASPVFYLTAIFGMEELGDRWLWLQIMREARRNR